MFFSPYWFGCRGPSGHGRALRGATPYYIGKGRKVSIFSALFNVFQDLFVKDFVGGISAETGTRFSYPTIEKRPRSAGYKRMQTICPARAELSAKQRLAADVCKPPFGCPNVG